MSIQSADRLRLPSANRSQILWKHDVQPLASSSLTFHSRVLGGARNSRISVVLFLQFCMTFPANGRQLRGCHVARKGVYFLLHLVSCRLLDQDLPTRVAFDEAQLLVLAEETNARIRECAQSVTLRRLLSHFMIQRVGCRRLLLLSFVLDQKCTHGVLLLQLAEFVKYVVDRPFLGCRTLIDHLVHRLPSHDLLGLFLRLSSRFALTNIVIPTFLPLIIALGYQFARGWRFFGQR